jgi:hypothetical protein
MKDYKLFGFTIQNVWTSFPSESTWIINVGSEPLFETRPKTSEIDLSRVHEFYLRNLLKIGLWGLQKIECFVVLVLSYCILKY